MKSFPYAALVLSLGLLFAAPSCRAGVYDDMLKAIHLGDVGSVQGLLAKGVDVDTTDRDGNTLLHIAAGDGQVEVVKLLLTYRARLNARNASGESALLIAAFRGHLEVVKRLVDVGANLEPVGWTPLMYGAFEGHGAVVAYLIEKGAKVDARAPNGATALMLAARNGHLEVVKHLLAADADAELETDQGFTALSWAEKGNHKEIAALIRQSIQEDEDIPPRSDPALGGVAQAPGAVEEKSPIQSPPSPSPAKEESGGSALKKDKSPGVDGLNKAAVSLTPAVPVPSPSGSK